MRPINRIRPQLPATAMKTYEIVRPVATHFRTTSCGEVNCQAYANGWKTTVDESTDFGQKQAHYIRRDSKRRFTEEKLESGLTCFTFASGQKCFRQHQMPLDREPLYRVRAGDFRGNPRGIPLLSHRNGDDWVDDFANHQDRLATRLEQG